MILINFFLFLLPSGRAEDSTIKIFSVGGRRNGNERERTESSDGAQEEHEGITKKAFMQPIKRQINN